MMRADFAELLRRDFNIGFRGMRLSDGTRVLLVDAVTSDDRERIIGHAQTFGLEFERIDAGVFGSTLWRVALRGFDEAPAAVAVEPEVEPAPIDVSKLDGYAVCHGCGHVHNHGPAMFGGMLWGVDVPGLPAGESIALPGKGCGAEACRAAGLVRAAFDAGRMSDEARARASRELSALLLGA